jgi:hypothetical protein
MCIDMSIKLYLKFGGLPLSQLVSWLASLQIKPGWRVPPCGESIHQEEGGFPPSPHLEIPSMKPQHTAAACAHGTVAGLHPKPHPTTSTTTDLVPAKKQTTLGPEQKHTAARSRQPCSHSSVAHVMIWLTVCMVECFTPSRCSLYS